MNTQAATRLAPYALTVLRVLVGITFLAHGYPKIGFYQGFVGFLGSLGVPLPQVVGVIVTLAEVVGGVALIIGLWTRWASLILAVEMVFTTLLVKTKLGFIVPAGQPGTGAELDLLLLASCLVLFTAGAGVWSVEGAMRKR